MGNMKRVLFTAMLMTLVIVATACGRDDNQNMTTTPMSSQASTEAGGTRETGGILQDVVDGVEQGMDNMMNGGSGTSGGNGSAGSGTGSSGSAGSGTGSSGSMGSGSGNSGSIGSTGSGSSGSSVGTHANENMNSATSGEE